MESGINNANFENSTLQDILVRRTTRFRSPYNIKSKDMVHDQVQNLKSLNILPTTAHFVKSEYINNIVKLCSNVDGCTQTSRTILQLANPDGDFTPDSLTPSPRSPAETNQETGLKYSDLNSQSTAVCEVDSTYTLEGSFTEHKNPSLTFLRKNAVKRCFDDSALSENFNLSATVDEFPKKTLTETFLAKKHEEQNNSMRYSRSQFLQQTSPLRNLSKDFSDADRSKHHLKSTSYAEALNQNHQQNFYYESPPRASRFTVTNVRAQNPNNERQLYWTTTEHQANALKTEPLLNNSHNVYFDQGSIPLRNVSRYRSITRRSGSFMLPTIASERRNQGHKVLELQHLLPPPRRVRSLSPNNSPSSHPSANHGENHQIDFILENQANRRFDQEPAKQQVWKQKVYKKSETTSLMAPLATRPKFEEDMLKIDLESLHVKSSQGTLNEKAYPSSVASTASSDNILGSTLTRIKDQDWGVALKGLAEMTELCRIMDSDLVFPHMITVNQRLLELLRSPRSHVCRTACQIAGHLFESMKDTRRPEFDDIVEVLLNKTADSNKFIREDANLSLDCMITHIPIYHTIRALCLKGPVHKNSLVRSATIRLIVCAVVIAGPSMILSCQSYAPTRKRVILHMAKFLDDKNTETRRYGERLFKVLNKEDGFDSALKKYLEKSDARRFKTMMKLKYEKR